MQDNSNRNGNEQYFNEIFHYFKKQGNAEAAESVKAIYKEYTRRNKL